MKILMLNPPYFKRFSRNSRSPAISKGGTLYYPIWLAYATGVLEEEGFDVRLIDGPASGRDMEEIVDEMRVFKPDLTVIDTSTPSIHNDVQAAEALKDASGSYIIMVGTHASAMSEETVRMSPKIDAAAREEYDYTINDLAYALKDKKDLETVPGINFRRGEEIISTPNRTFIKDMDSLPFVSKVYKKHLDHTHYFYAHSLHPIMTIITGRGCPYDCVYCVLPQTMNGKGYRKRSAANVADEFEYIKENFPDVKEIMIEDDTLTVDQKRCRALSETLIERGIKMTWTANSRADVDLETMQYMRKAGCRLFCVGIESGDQDVLDQVKKRLEVDRISQFMGDAKKAGIMVHGCFMVGNPGETKETLVKTLDFAKELKPDTAQFFPIMVYPGTAAYDWAKENGYLLTEDYSKWLTSDGLHNSVVSRPGLTNEELVDFCDMARRSFYLRPQYISFKLWQGIRNPREGQRTLKSAGTFLKYLFRGSLHKAQA